MDASATTSQLPIVKTVDVLIFGGCSGAVTLALQLKEAGLEPFIVAPRSYLGEDICSAFRFWPKQGPDAKNSLASKVFGDAEPPTPLKVKITLEQSLVEAGISFLFNAMPAGVLRDADGRVVGAAMAHRGGRQAIRARLVVDATLEGQVLSQAGLSVHVPQGELPVTWVSLSEGEGRNADGLDVKELPGYDHEDYQLSARCYQLTADFGDGSAPARGRALTSVMRACWTPEEFRCQTILRPQLPVSDAIPSLKAMMVQPGLLAFSESAKLPGGAEFAFAEPVASMSLGYAFGAGLPQLLAPAYSGNVEFECAGSTAVEGGEIRSLSQGLRPSDEVSEFVDFDPHTAPILGDYGVVVVGGGTGGSPAGIASARAGAKTLVLEASSGLGGVGTVGQIAKYWFGNRVGFTAEIDQGVAALEVKEKFQKGEGTWSAAVKSHWYLDTGASEGADYWFNTACVGAWVVDGAVRGVLAAGPNGFGLIKAKCVIDSTGCSDIPAAAGAETRVIGKDHVAVQGVGLAGVKPGREYHNSDHGFSDDTDVVDATAFFVSSRLKFPDDFDSGELVDSRERRQIVGEYSLTAVDILYERRFPDTICVATSNFDTHGFTIDPSFMVIPPNHDALWADVPLRCLLPKGLDGVLATGLGVSAHRDALPVIRMQPDVQNHGYAAGFLAALSATTGRALRDIDVKEVQEHLIKIGSLPERVLTDEDSFPVSDEVLAEQINEGWDKASGVALILREQDRSINLLRKAYDGLSGERSAQSLRYAQLLGLMGDDHAVEELMETISGRDWDAGWNYRGMGQFGMSMSELDSLIVALGACGDARAWSCLFSKMEALTSESEFSHFRVVGMACEALQARHPHEETAGRLAQLLELPGMCGHAFTNLKSAKDIANDNLTDTESRNFALREIHVARSLLLCGESQGRGQAILEQYAQDLRGHFARHASSIMVAAREMKPVEVSSAK